jgi:WD40 repeat protein
MLTTLPGGNLVSCGHSTVFIWNPVHGTCEGLLIGHTRDICSMAAMAGNLFAAGALDHTIRIWDTSNSECLHVFEIYDIPRILATTTEGDLLIAAANTVRRWNFETLRSHVWFAGHTKAVTCVAVLPEDQLASGSDDMAVRIWDVSDGRCVHHLRGHTGHVSALLALPDNQLASGSSDCTVRVWHTVKAVCLFTLRGHTDSVEALAFNGKLISGSFDLMVWNIATGVCLRKLDARGQGVRNLVVMPGGLLASCALSKKLQVWNVDDGVLLHELSGHSEAIMSVVVLPDGRLASGSLDRTVRVWD